MEKLIIIPDAKGGIRKEKIEIPENISNAQSLYLHIKKKCKLPDLSKDEIWVCSEDERRVLTLFVVSQGDEILYTSSKLNDTNPCTSINTLYLFYCTQAARAEEIFITNDGSHYYMWHDGWHDEYSSYQITKEQENEWLGKHELNQRK